MPAIRRYLAPRLTSAVSFVSRDMICSGKKRVPPRKTTVTTIIYLMARARIRSTVSRSPFPQYWAASMVVPWTRTVTQRLYTEVTCPARDTADKASCSRKPSMRASEALTRAVMRFWNAMGSTIAHKLR